MSLSRANELIGRVLEEGTSASSLLAIEQALSHATSDLSEWNNSQSGKVPRAVSLEIYRLVDVLRASCNSLISTYNGFRSRGISL